MWGRELGTPFSFVLPHPPILCGPLPLLLLPPLLLLRSFLPWVCGTLLCFPFTAHADTHTHVGSVGAWPPLSPGLPSAAFPCSKAFNEKKVPHSLALAGRVRTSWTQEPCPLGLAGGSLALCSAKRTEALLGVGVGGFKTPCGEDVRAPFLGRLNENLVWPQQLIQPPG